MSTQAEGTVKAAEGYCMIWDFKYNGRLLSIFKQRWPDQFVFYKGHSGFCVETALEEGNPGERNWKLERGAELFLCLSKFLPWYLKVRDIVRTLSYSL